MSVTVTDRARAVPRFPGYWAKADGTVVRSDGRALSEHDATGYARVSVVDEHGRRRGVLVHRLIAAAFHGPCPPGAQVNHIDGDKRNNLHAAGATAASIGRTFGIDTTHAWRICTRRSWKHLP